VQQKEPILFEKAKFYIPDPKENEEYLALKQRFNSYEKTVMVDDYVEIKNIIKEANAIDPYKVESEFIPRLRKLIAESNGRLKDFFIWPQYLPGGDKLIYPDGRRYPKRLRLYKEEPEDREIFINGINVGYIKPNVPNLHPETWRGQGIALE
jgi:hypothetical protein